MVNHLVYQVVKMVTKNKPKLNSSFVCLSFFNKELNKQQQQQKTTMNKGSWIAVYIYTGETSASYDIWTSVCNQGEVYFKLL